LKFKLQHTTTCQVKYDHPAACVIAQQHSSATFVLLPFYFCKGKIFRVRFKNFTISTFFNVLKFPATWFENELQFKFELRKLSV
jgi:hypothetical protein